MIAVRRNVAEATVDRHIANIRIKFHTKTGRHERLNLIQLARVAFQAGITTIYFGEPL